MLGTSGSFELYLACHRLVRDRIELVLPLLALTKTFEP